MSDLHPIAAEERTSREVRKSAKKGHSADLDEILVRQRSSRKLSELAAERERSKIDAEEADPIDECRHFRFCCLVVAGIEQHAPAAIGARIVGQNFRAKVIERLHDPRSRHEIGKHLTRYAALEIDRLEQWRLDRIVGVDDNPAAPIRKPT